MKDYKQYDAVALAELVKKGETTPAELIDAAIDQMKAFLSYLPANISFVIAQSHTTAANVLVIVATAPLAT